MVLGLVGFEPQISRMVEESVTRSGHFCMVFDSSKDLEAMIRDEIELPTFDTLIFEGTHHPRLVRFSLGMLASLRGELFTELCVVSLEQDRELWEPLEGEVDQWLESLHRWRCEVIYLFGPD